MEETKNVIYPPRKNERIRIPGRTEEEVKKIIREKRNAYYRERRAQARKAKEAEEEAKANEPKARNMYFTVRPNAGATHEDMMDFRRKLSGICADSPINCRETLEPRYAVYLEGQTFCRVEYPSENNLPK